MADSVHFMIAKYYDAKKWKQISWLLLVWTPIEPDF